MKEIIIKKTVFEFGELSEKAKKKVVEDYKNDAATLEINHEYFMEGFKEKCKGFTGDTNLKMQYDFSCCQGSGLNIYGTLGAIDIYNLAETSKNFTHAELYRLKFYIGYLDGIELSNNKHYTYSTTEQDKERFDVNYIIDNYYIVGDNIDVDNALLDLMYKDIDLIEKMYNNAFDYIANLETKLYTIGDEIFNCDCNTFEEMEEVSECNDWYYYADGSLATDVL